jgi:hypothetical protein
MPALDFAKGALVLIMVFYHWLNYFVSTEGPAYIYLRFLTPSFIFITGFLISHVQLAKRGAGDHVIPGRLIVRGLKILALFIALNAVRIFLVPDIRSGVMPADPLSRDVFSAVFLTGNVSTLPGGGKAASFYILVPISYLLLLSGGVAMLCRYVRHAFRITCAILLVSIAILGLNGVQYGNLELLTAGVLGAALGSISKEALAALVNHAAGVGLIYFCYVAAVSVWDIAYLYPVQLVGVSVNLALIHVLAHRWLGTRVGTHVVLLGQYSLVGYVGQIAILQALYRGLRPLHLGPAEQVVSLLGALALTVMSVEVLDRLRARTPVANRLYKAVFA